ncbi:MAG: tRNA uridine-5-carboxymethylaminomethyl(34) synthesis enzyme MnmG, partial [Terriglobales bacterium]
SRAEFRLHLRIDNADRRLTPHGRRVGLISDSAWADFEAKQERMVAMKQLLEKARLTGEMAERLRVICHPERREAQANVVEGPAVSGSDFSSMLGQTLAQLLKRPEIVIEQIAPALRELSADFFDRDPASSAVKLSSEVRNELKSVETEIKYEGYLLQQQRAIDRLKKAEHRTIPEWFDYRSVSGLSIEMQQTFLKIRPTTLAHASRIPGVTPAALSLVNVFIEIQARRRDQAAAI